MGPGYATTSAKTLKKLVVLITGPKLYVVIGYFETHCEIVVQGGNKVPEDL